MEKPPGRLAYRPRGPHYANNRLFEQGTLAARYRATPFAAMPTRRDA